MRNYLTKNKILLLLGVFLGSFLLVYLRDPSVFRHAQFWGEDGIKWFGQAYNDGILLSIFKPYASSLQVGMRLVASTSMVLPLKLAPLFFVLSATVVQILPVVLLFTDRFKKLTGSTRNSSLFAAFYLLMPNSFEVNANLTNMNWHLALIVFMILISGKTESKLWQVFDTSVLFISGLTGPFSIIVLPIAFWLWKRGKVGFPYLAVYSVTSVVQTIVYLLSKPEARFTQGLGASPVKFLAIIGSRITGGLLVGMETINKYALANQGWFAVLGAVTLALLIFVLIKAPYKYKMIIIFTWLIFFVALIKPQASNTVPQWTSMVSGGGNRYFWLPMIGLFSAILFLFSYANKYARSLAVGLLLCMVLLGIPSDFSYPQKSYTNFSNSVQKFNNAHSGERVCLEVNPSSDWLTCLNKH